jgi:hypothetical protein
MACAGIATVDGLEVLVYGSVLPWRSAVSQAPDVFPDVAPKTKVHEVYGTWLAAQVRDIIALRRAHPGVPLLWAGDFNVPLAPPFRHHIPKGSAILKDALGALDLVAYNRLESHRVAGVRAIDLICGPAEWRCKASAVAAQGLGSPLSDHPCYVVDLEP